MHSVHTAHAAEVRILERLGLFEVLRVAVHYPNPRLGHIADLAAGAPKDSGEDGSLVFQQEGGEGDGKDEGEILGAISGEHFKGDEIHIFE